ncbi:MAG: NAD(P)-dependent oxidoreductase [Rhizobiaceae bacterium]|nr:NAD(P)-dependent oxidoreductase [Rhizobiaceae bacterium]
MTVICGYIGAGKMGGRMIERLLHAGNEVVLWGRSPDKLKPYEEAGASIAPTAAELCRRCDVVITSVSDTAAMRAVVFGPEGIAQGAGPHKILVDMSTISPIETEEMAASLAEKTGMIWIDAPVSGGTGGAANGTLAVMAGGPEDAIERVRPVLEPLCRNLTRVGDSGAGQKAKMVNQTLVSTMFVLLSEVLNFAEKIGIDASTIPQALNGGYGDSNLLQREWPRMVKRQFGGTGPHDTALQVLAVVRLTATAAASLMPLNSLAGEMIRQRVHEGHGGEDMAALFKLYDRKST